MKVLRCHVGYTTIFHGRFPSAVLLRKLTVGREQVFAEDSKKLRERSKCEVFCRVSKVERKLILIH